MDIIAFIFCVWLLAEHRKKLVPCIQAILLLGVGWWGVHLISNLFMPVKPSLSFFIFDVILVIVALIWGVKIWRDPNLSREEKWKRLNGKY